MTTFQNLVDLTTQITRRPEFGPLTATAVRTAVLRAHTTGFFVRDSVSAILPCVITEMPWIDILNPYDTLPLLRAIEQVQMLEPTNLTPVEQLQYEERTNILAPGLGSGIKLSRYTLEGDKLRLFPVMQTTKCAVQYYLKPDVRTDTFSSWISNEFPEEVAFWAASIVFARSGALDQAQMLLKSSIMPFKELLTETYMIGTVN